MASRMLVILTDLTFGSTLWNGTIRIRRLQRPIFGVCCTPKSDISISMALRSRGYMIKTRTWLCKHLLQVVYDILTLSICAWRMDSRLLLLVVLTIAIPWILAGHWIWLPWRPTVARHSGLCQSTLSTWDTQDCENQQYRSISLQSWVEALLLHWSNFLTQELVL